jgi:hypothetical protein
MPSPELRTLSPQDRTAILEMLVEVSRDSNRSDWLATLRHLLASSRVRTDWLVVDLLEADPGFEVVRGSVRSLIAADLIAETVVETFMGEIDEPLLDEDEAMTADDLLRLARIEGEAKRRILEEPMFDARGLADALGSTARNPREFASSWRRRAGVLALRRGNRFLFPCFQFDVGEQRVWPVAQEANLLLGAADDPWGVASWWFCADPLLQARPADLVGTPDRAADLRAAVDRERAPVG